MTIRNIRNEERYKHNVYKILYILCGGNSNSKASLCMKEQKQTEVRELRYRITN